MKTYKVYNGFTLVELIVVITILAILWTIAFLSMQWYSQNARDSVRISDLKNIEKWLELFSVKTWFYPDNENVTNVIASWTIIWYQWYFWSVAARWININKTPLDPLDNQGYIYSLNSTKTKYQLMTFLELSSQSSMINQVNAIDYSKRIPKTFWDNLWILLDINNNPISWPSLDILNTNSIYTMYFDNTEKITWTWVALKAWIAWWWLVWYWDFDEWSGNVVYDKTWNWNNWTFSWTFWSPTWVSGKVWWWLDFSSNSGLTSTWGSYVEFENLKNMFVSSEGTPHTIAWWLYVPNQLCTWPKNETCRQWILLLWTPSDWSDHWLIGWLDWPSQFWIWWGSQINFPYTVWGWMFVAVSFDGRNLLGYVNWQVINSTDNSSSKTKTFKLKDSKFSIWWKYQWFAFDGKIDELRIYNRGLSISEIQSLYDSSK